MMVKTLSNHLFFCQYQNNADLTMMVLNEQSYVNSSFNGTARFKNVNNSLNTNLYSYLETSGGQISNPYLNVVQFFNTRVV
jgi:hypothetical protein